jgi:formylglycine-generating enzyme required for sulfatase activity
MSLTEILFRWTFLSLLFLSVAGAVEDENEIPHPDPNDEDHEGMIYVGRLCSETGRRLMANETYSISYIFGTSFPPEEKEPDDAASPLPKLKRFGHVDTHPLDGGVTPPTWVTVEPFWLDATPVTNQDFADFVARTYYVTEAEKYGWSYVLESSWIERSTDPEPSIPPDDRGEREYEVDPGAEHWVALPGTKWSRPLGRHTSSSTSSYQKDHPVVHVSHHDAVEYCAWKGKRLPGEREYEAAARWNANRDVATAERTIYAWGNASDWAMAARYANLWGPDPPQQFPHGNAGRDGFVGTSPVQQYPPNALGFYDLTGNVWEWMRGGSRRERILRGASYVDSLDGSLNHAATLGARAVTHGSTTAGNIGFRCAKSVQKRVEHHWTWHDEEMHGPLAPEDEYYEGDEDEVDAEDDDKPKRKKKKVVVKHERIQTEL